VILDQILATVQQERFDRKLVIFEIGSLDKALEGVIVPKGPVDGRKNRSISFVINLATGKKNVMLIVEPDAAAATTLLKD